MRAHRVTDTPIELDKHRGMAAQKATDIRRVIADVEANAKLLRDKQGVEAKTVLMESSQRDAAASIVAQARKQRAELIVLGTHGRRGLRRIVLGSDAEQVVRAASVPVLLVRSPS